MKPLNSQSIMHRPTYGRLRCKNAQDVMHNWLRSVMLLMFALTGIVAASGQEIIEGGEAFYIYQNDGNFNGFFYDQVQQISYSRFDTLGVEHDDYVSQEIVTADSTYRIMLTAIDSVSFVQPEIKYARGARFMRDEGLMDYYISMSKSGDTFKLTFNDNLPSSLYPKVDEVLICKDLPDYDEAFVGKVKRVSGSGGVVTVECGYVDQLSDVFEQFITVEEVKGDNVSKNVRRRIAGYNGPRRIEGNYDNLTLFAFSRDFEDNLVLGESSNSALKVGLKLHMGMGMSATVAYKITWTEFFINTQLREFFEVGLNTTLDGSISGDWDLTSIPGVGALLSRFTRIPFPASIPVMYLNVAPVPFIRAEAHLTAGLNTDIIKKAFRQSFTVKSESPYIDFSFNSEPGGSMSDSFTLYAELSGMIQMGVKFPIMVGEEDWLHNIFSFDLSNTVYAGPKLSGSFSFDFLKNGDAYKAYRNTKLELSRYSLDNESVMKFVGWRGFIREKKWTHSFNFGSATFTLFPSVSNMKYELTGNLLNTVKAHFDTSGDVFWPQHLGIGLYTKANDADTKFTKLYKSRMRAETYFLNTYNSADLEITNVDPGEYRLRPIISLAGGSDVVTPVYDEEQTVVIAPRELLLSTNEITAEETGGEFTIELINSIDMPITSFTEQNWIHPEVQNRGVNGMFVMVKVDPNDTYRYRTGTVTVRLRLTTLDTVEKTITVKQYGGLQISPTSLNFSKAGGEAIVDVLTSHNPITVGINGADSWLSYELKERKLKIIAKENKGAARSATVTVSSYSGNPGGFNAVELKVSQASGDVDISVTKTEVTLESNGISQQVAINAGSFTFSAAVVRKEFHSWLMVEKQTSGVIITATPNTTGKVREGYIDLTFTKKGADGQNYQVQETIKVIQKTGAAPFISPTTLTFEAGGGTQSVTVTPQGYTRRGYVIDKADKEWLSASFGEKNTIAFTALPNTTGKDRTTTVKCYVTNEENSTDAQRVYMALTVTQKSGSASISPTELSFLTGGGTKSVTFKASGYNYFGYETPPSWLTIKKGESNTYEITATENSTGKDRTVTVNCFVTNVENPTSAQKVYLPVKITQSGIAPSVSPTTLTFETAGGTQSVTVKPQGYGYRGYVIESADKSWLSAAFGDNNTIAFTATANTTGKERTATVRCYVSNAKSSTDDQRTYMSVKITQKSGSASISPTELTFLKGGGTKNVTIKASGYKYFACESASSWLTVKRGDGNTYNITADENTTGSERTGTVKFFVTNSENPTAADKVYLNVKVTQKVTAPSVSPTTLSFEAAGGMKSVTVTPQGYAYRGYVIENADKSWLSAAFGDNNTIEFTATANTAGKERTATVRCYVSNVKGSTDDQRTYMSVKITQKSGSASVTPSELTFLKGGGTKSVTIKATGYKYFACESASSWLTVKRGDGNTYNITADENTTGSERTGTVKFFVTNSENPTAADKVYLPVTVTQKAIAPSVSPTTLTFDGSGGTKSVTVAPQGYGYRGYVIADADKSWLSAAFGDNNTIAFTAKANTTGKDRTATVRCYVSNVKSSTDAQRTYMSVKITQSASSQESAYRIDGASIHIDFSAVLSCVDGGKSYVKDDGWDNLAAGGYNDNKRTEVVVTHDTNGYHVTCSRNVTKSDGSKVVGTCSFDIDDLNKLESKKAIISNIKVEWKSESTNYTQQFKATSKSKLSMTGPLELHEGTYSYDGNKRIYLGEWENSKPVFDVFEYKQVIGNNSASCKSPSSLKSANLTVGVTFAK